MASFSLPSIEIVFSRPSGSTTSGNHGIDEPQGKNGGKYRTTGGKTFEICKKTGAVICKTTGKVLKKTAIVWPIKLLLGILDVISTPFANMAGKDLNFSKLWKVGCAIIILAFWLLYIMDTGAAIFFKQIGVGEAGALKLALIAKILAPGGLCLMGVSMILGGMRLQMNRTFLQMYGMGLEPLPAFESGVIFRIGDVKLSLRDTHTGIGAFGGVGSGKDLEVNDNEALTPNRGYKKIDDFQIGEPIKTPTGEAIITKIIEFENKEIWELNTQSFKARSGEGHLWSARLESDPKGTISVIETKEIYKLVTIGKKIWLPTLQGEEEVTSVYKTKQFSRTKCFVLSGTDHHFIINGGLITHNCLHPDQEVMMWDGRKKKCKDVVQGDWLMGPDGLPRTVKTTSTGFGPLYKIIPTGSKGDENVEGSSQGNPWICNDVHVMTLKYTSKGRSRPKREMNQGKTTINRMERDKHYKGLSYVYGEKILHNKKHAREVQKILEQRNFIEDVDLNLFLERSGSNRPSAFWKLFRPHKELEFGEYPNLTQEDINPRGYKKKNEKLLKFGKEEFYLTGCWLGDGNKRLYTWYNQDEEIKNSIYNYASKFLGIEVTKKGDSRKPNENFKALTIRSTIRGWTITPLQEMINECCLTKAKRGGTLFQMYREDPLTKKWIPHWAKTSPPELRKQLLAGLLDTDGHLNRKGRCFDFVQNRKEITEAVVFMCRSLGLAASEPEEEWKEATNGTTIKRPYWRTTISGNIENIPTRVPHKQVSSIRPQKGADTHGLKVIDGRNTKDPLCFGWDAEPIGNGPYCGFTLDGDGRFLLGDFTVTHNTVALMVPMMRQFFRQLRSDDDNSEFAKCGALILDEKGDFIDSTITEMMLANRSLQDLVIIDPDLDLYRYNPLDPNQSADENAAKLAKVQKILGTSSGGDNAYWDQTSQMTIKYFLQLLEVYKPKHKIGLDDIARFMRDDELAGVLCDTVEKTIEEKKRSNEISEEAYGMYTDAVSSTRNAWIQLNPNTKSTLKTTITNMLGPIASNPRLQKVFCRDTNFSFRDLPNRGKIVLFRGSGVDKSTARLICVCLKIDFQTWQKRRNGSSATAYGLNTNRTVVFMCDEYQEFVTCGGEGDETFYGVSRSTRTAPIVATQSYNSLETAIKNKEQTKTLRQNIATWVFFRSTDQDTCELGKFLAGQSKKEDFSTSQDTTGFLETASNLGGGGGNKGSSISISKKLEENFRTDDFSRLVTMTMEKSKSGPWYSEAIIYHYHDIDDSAESRCYKTRLTHLYYDNKLRKQAALNVKHLDYILYDRNWQRKAMQRGLLMIQRSVYTTTKQKKEDTESRKGRSDVDIVKQRAETSELEADKLRRVTNLVQTTQKEIKQDEQKSFIGSKGSIRMDEDLTADNLNEKVRELKEQKEQTGDEVKARAIQVQIDATRKLINRFALLDASAQPDTKKEILRADGTPYNFDDDDQEDGTQRSNYQVDYSDNDIEVDQETIERLASRASPRNNDDGEEEQEEDDPRKRRRLNYESYSYEEDEEKENETENSLGDDLWETNVIEARRRADLSVVEDIPLGVIDGSEAVTEGSEELEDSESSDNSEDSEGSQNSQSSQSSQSNVYSHGDSSIELEDIEDIQNENFNRGSSSSSMNDSENSENSEDSGDSEGSEDNRSETKNSENETGSNSHKYTGLFEEEFPSSLTPEEENSSELMDNFIGGFEGLGSSEIPEDKDEDGSETKK